MSNKRQQSSTDTHRWDGGTDRDRESHSRVSGRPSLRSEVVRVDRGDDPLVQALLGAAERDSAPPREEPHDLSPESLALLLDRLDGMVEGNDPAQDAEATWPNPYADHYEAQAQEDAAPKPAPAAPGRSGVVPRRPQRPQRGAGLYGWLAFAAVLLTAGVWLLWPTPPPSQPAGSVEGHAPPRSDVRQVALPAAPPPAREDDAPVPVEGDVSGDAVGQDDAKRGPAPRSAPSRRGEVRLKRAGGSAEVRLRGQVIGRAPGVIRLRPGRHDLLIRTSEGVSYYRTVRVRAGKRVELTLP